MSDYQLFGRLDSETFAALEKDILERGIMVPVELDDKGNVLDGHHRIEIAEKHGLKFPKEIRRDWTEEEKKIHVLKLNLARRQLRPHERGVAIRQYFDLRGVCGHGGNRTTEQDATLASCSEELGLPPRTAQWYIEQADLYEQLPTEEREAVDRGEKSLSSAARKLKQAKKRDDAAKAAEIKGRYSVVYADPPWSFGAASVSGGADQHYATMSQEDICALPVRDHVTRAAALFLWAPNSHVPEALEVMRAWGFSYKTYAVWVKDKAIRSLGYHFRARHETLLYGTRGDLIPESARRPSSVIEAPVAEHSRKPDCVYRMIEKMYPGMRYLEMFARGAKRKGWKTYGAEA